MRGQRRGSPGEVPRYTIVEVARYIGLRQSTLGSWVRGWNYETTRGEAHSLPLIHRPDPEDPRLSFVNLVEAYVLRALRSTFDVPMHRVRVALSTAEREFGIDRLLSSSKLRAAPGKMFLDQVGDLVDLTSGGQKAMREVLKAYLKRLVFDRGGPRKLYPIVRPNGYSGPQVVAIMPRISFGRPVVERRSVQTMVIAERFAVGESTRDLANDYELKIDEVEEAIRYEQEQWRFRRAA